MRTLRIICCLAIALISAGCAHPLVINPDIARIGPEAGAKPIAKNVGYYIASDDRDRAVTTAGGGGETVTYFPYKDIETGFYRMLSNVFQNVVRLNSPNDADTIAKRSIAYVIKPEIMTNSSSSSVFTWAPTQFTLILNSNISDASGKPVAKPSVMGDGRAEFEEFISDSSLAANRAALDALLKMQRALLGLPELRSP